MNVVIYVLAILDDLDKVEGGPTFVTMLLALKFDQLIYMSSYQKKESTTR